MGRKNDPYMMGVSLDQATRELYNTAAKREGLSLSAWARKYLTPAALTVLGREDLLLATEGEADPAAPDVAESQRLVREAKARKDEAIAMGERALAGDMAAMRDLPDAQKAALIAELECSRAALLSPEDDANYQKLWNTLIEQSREIIARHQEAARHPDPLVDAEEGGAHA